MKKLTLVLSAWLLASSLFFASCGDDDNETLKEEFASGVVVVNEGNFSDGDGTLSFYNPESKTVTQDLFGSKNNGVKILSIIQSITIDNDLAYIVANTGNRLEVVNATSFVSEYTLSDLEMPRYFTVVGGKGYLTEWVSYSDPGRVSVVNLTTHEVETTITTGYGAENIIAAGGKLYVSNNFESTVSVIDPADNEVIKTIEVGSSPGEFVVDKDSKLWVICGGGYGEDGPLNDGSFQRINTSTDEVDKTVELNKNVSGRVAINKTRDGIFYFSGKSIYELSTTATEAPSAALVTQADAVGFYGIGFDTENEIIYVGDNRGFIGNGTVYRYQKSGALIGSFTSGRGPNGFIFRQ